MAKKPAGRMTKDLGHAAAKTPAGGVTAPVPAVKKPKDAAPLTDDERRVQRNEYVRKWRKANAERYSEYMRSWREKKQKQAGASAAKKKPAGKKPAPSMTGAARAETVPSGVATA